jgi:excinuclease ABC subunit C
VAFLDGAPDKQQYRRYRIRSVDGQDDFAMLQEVFARRFSPQKIAAWGLPDLVVVDGGIGQLNSVLAIFDNLGLRGKLPVVSLAKSRVKGDGKDTTVERSEERVFLPGRRNPVRLRQDGAALRLLAAIRDEAHRFAITYHRTLREQAALRSSLRDIPGIGTGRERLLLRQFGSLEGVRKATLEELMTCTGISRNQAELISRILAP